MTDKKLVLVFVLAALAMLGASAMTLYATVVVFGWLTTLVVWAVASTLSIFVQRRVAPR